MTSHISSRANAIIDLSPFLIYPPVVNILHCPSRRQQTVQLKPHQTGAAGCIYAPHARHVSKQLHRKSLLPESQNGFVFIALTVDKGVDIIWQNCANSEQNLLHLLEPLLKLNVPPFGCNHFSKHGSKRFMHGM